MSHKGTQRYFNYTSVCYHNYGDLFAIQLDMNVRYISAKLGSGFSFCYEVLSVKRRTMCMLGKHSIFVIILHPNNILKHPFLYYTNKC